MMQKPHAIESPPDERALSSATPINTIEPSFRRDLRHATALPAAVLATACVALVLMVLYVQRLHRLVDHADVVLGRGNLLSKLTEQRDGALRGFLLSRDKAFLDEFNAVDAQLSPTFDALQDLIEDRPRQLALVRAARVEVIRCRHYAAQQVDRARDGASVAQIAEHLADGEKIIGDIRRDLQQFMALAEQVRSERVHRADTVPWYMLVGGVLVGLAMGGGLSRATGQRMRIVRRRYVDALHEQRRAEKALAVANARLRDADARKDEFLGVLSHELRNPLAPIRNSVYVLNHGVPGSAADRRARRIVERQVDHLTRLVEDLLDVKRLSVGKMRIRSDDLDLAVPVRETVEDLRALFVQRGIELRVETPRERIPVRGDAARLAQVVTNLLHNALKFADPGGHVAVRLDVRDDGAAHLLVRDDGAGMSPEAMAHVFDPFVQSEATLDRTRGGLGLGLALVRGIVELHGGKVAGRSEGLGKGAEFEIVLPTVGACAADREKDMEPAPAATKRVLIIEDNQDAAASLRDVLGLVAGHDVHVASDGAAGVEAAHALRPDVVLCDLGLPVVDGFEVARRLSARDGPRPMLVALSGYASADDVERSRAAGFDRHLAKPPDIDALLRIINGQE